MPARISRLSAAPASVAALLVLLGTTFFGPSTITEQSPNQSLSWQPPLLREAAGKGIWPGMGAGEEGESNRAFFVRTQETYAISDYLNPYYQQGDFDHDGICDLAIAIVERATGRQGFALIPGTLDTVHLVNVGPSSVPEQDLGFRGWDVEYITGPYVRKIDRDRLIVYRKNGPAIAYELYDGKIGTYMVSDIDDMSPEPALVREARKEGLWPKGIRYEIIRERDHNPSWLRGDFNGDGEFDIAVLVRDTSNREQGIVIVHSTLDTLYALFDSTAGEGQGGIMNPSRILRIPKGEVLRPWAEGGEKPEITLTGDAIRAGWPGAPWSGAWYYRDGKYLWVTLSD
jgi:hypothetical protein